MDDGGDVEGRVLERAGRRKSLREGAYGGEEIEGRSTRVLL